MTTLNINLLLVLFLSSLACKKTKFPNTESKQIIGNWRYINKITGNSTPSMLDNYDLEFTDRSKFKYYKNNKKASSTKYELVVRNSIYGTEFSNQIKFSNSDNYMSFKISNDTLYLNDEILNGNKYIYFRK